VYSAFAGNLLMSVLFCAMLVRRRSLAGQSIWLALCKLIGTAAASAEFHTRAPDNQLLHVLFAACALFDLGYVALLVWQARASRVALFARL
jgi:hypothetical protein